MKKRSAGERGPVLSTPAPSSFAPEPLDVVLRTTDLASRPSRSPDHRGESRALGKLMEELTGGGAAGLFQQLVERALDLCRADSAGISILESGEGPECFRWSAISGRLQALAGGTIERQESPCGVVLDRNEPLLFVHPERRFRIPLPPDAPIFEALLVPFHAQGVPAGTLWVVSHTPERRFDREDARLLTSLSRFASAAHRMIGMVHAESSARAATEAQVRVQTRELKETNAALRRSEATLEHELAAAHGLQRVSTRMIQADDFHSLYDQILDTAVAITRADFAMLQMLDPGRGAAGGLKLIGSRGFGKDMERVLDWMACTPETPGGDAALSGQRVIVPDLSRFASKDGDAWKVHAAAGVRALQATPLLSRSGDAILGTLTTGWRQEREPTAGELRLVDILARLAADLIERREAETTLRRAKEDLERRVAERTAELSAGVHSLQGEVSRRIAAERALVQRSEHLRALAGEITLVEHRQRRRLAQILHDDLQQSLVGAKFRVSLLQTEVPKGLRDEVGAIETLLNDCLDSARNLTADLSPPVLHEEGLLAGLRWLARRMSDRQGLEVQLEAPGSLPPLPEDMKVLLFDAVRELMQNVLKHSGVRQVEVEVKPDEGQELRLSVRDAGRGFDPKSLDPLSGSQSGFGLFSIRERLELLGGKLEIDSGTGQGCRVTLVAPVSQPALVEGTIVPRRPLGRLMPPGAVRPAPGGGIRVLIVDDHPVMREGLTLLLSRQPDMSIVGHAADGAQAVEMTRQLRPRVVLMDISMPRLSGIEASRIICRENPGVRVIGLSLHEDAERQRAMLEAGAVRYLSKTRASEDLVAAIRESVAERPGERTH
jgi:signal transduction histidine kinase/ActR/RegA family two-component response regulator